MKQYLTNSILVFSLFIAGTAYAQRPVRVRNASPSPRTVFAVQKLFAALQANGYRNAETHPVAGMPATTIIVGKKNDTAVSNAAGALGLTIPELRKEGFFIHAEKNTVLVAGADESGVLYGCLELAEAIGAQHRIPLNMHTSDAPEMVLRGTCIGLQKPYYLPGRTVYEYPYTPETFPWFYNRQHWLQVLDSMLANRMNSLYLWNGHPFASLVKLKEYPYAVEVDDSTFKRNEDMYRFITAEADKRGIWVIQMFYNIIVSKPFAEYHHIKTQDRERPIIPLIADYTRKSIAAFVEKYPNTGLMVCLGEAMEGVGKDDIEWFTKTIIPGVQDGLKALGKKEEPPIVLRAHDTDAPAVMKAALPLYSNLYTEAKFNGEALTTPRPRGAWAALHQTLSRLGSVQIENVHILANLEPFRYGSPDFIRQSVTGMHEVMGGNGLHLYPQASYWDWPYTADSVKGKRLWQIERDWIWYGAWSRYAWKAKRDSLGENAYWSKKLAARFGCSEREGKNILAAYEQSGEIAPKLLRRFGITDGNRQTLTLGMLMTQLINPYRYGLFTLLYESESPEGEMLTDYAEKEWKKQPHNGETPARVIHEVKQHADKAVAAIERAATGITAGKAEFGRLKNDMYCYRALAYHYAFKAEAALHVLRYKYSADVKDLEAAMPLLEQSVREYRLLARLTKDSYRYANSMQTQQRKIPIRGSNGTFKHWTEVLVPMEEELRHFRHKIDSLKNDRSDETARKVRFREAAISLGKTTAEWYTLDSAAPCTLDRDYHIRNLVPELKGLQALRLSFREQLQSGTELRFSAREPVKILVGYFNPKRAAFAKDTVYLKPPELETNAGANNYGQAEVKIANALVIPGLPPVNVHSYSFPAGDQVLKLPKGFCIVLGVVAESQPIVPYDAGLTESGIKREIDWLFE